MARPKLSICIPTRNRASHLTRLIRFLLVESDFPFPIEVCVSDNASTDETPGLVAEFMSQGLPIRYRRNERGVSVWTNHSNALRLGHGEYLLVMADDDILIVPQLIKVIRTFEADANIVAAYAPFEYYDEVNGLGGRYSYDRDRLPETTRLSVQNPLGTIEFFLNQVVPPELLVYRADVAANLFNETRYCYPYLFDMCSLLLQGDVVFFRDPFYRWVTESSVPGQRFHAGMLEGAAGWNNWRGGLEEMFQTLLIRCGIALDANGKAHLKRMLDLYELRRMGVTLIVALNAREYLKAYEAYARIRAFCDQTDQDPLSLPVMAMARDLLVAGAPAGFLAHIVAQEQNCDRVMLIDVGDPGALGSLLRDQGVKQEIHVVTSGGRIPPVEPAPPTAMRLFVVETREAKRGCIAAGYPPGQVMDLETLRIRMPV